MNMLYTWQYYIYLFFYYSNNKQVVKRQADDAKKLRIFGFHVLETAKEPELEEGIPIFKAGTSVKFRLFGEGFTDDTMIGMTSEVLESGQKCHKMIGDTFKVSWKKIAQEFSLETHNFYVFVCAGDYDR